MCNKGQINCPGAGPLSKTQCKSHRIYARYMMKKETSLGQQFKIRKAVFALPVYCKKECCCARKIEQVRYS